MATLQFWIIVPVYDVILYLQNSEILISFCIIMDIDY